MCGAFGGASREGAKEQAKSQTYDIFVLRRRAVLWTVVTAATLSIFHKRQALGFIRSMEANDKPIASAVELSLSGFLELSRYVTGRSDLQSDIGQRLLNLYGDDPRALKRLSQLHRHIAAWNNGAAPSTSFDFWVRTTQPTKELEAAAMRLLEHWYTGIYRNQRKAIVFAYDDALMYRPCAEVHPIPTRCGGAMGYWSKPPDVPHVTAVIPPSTHDQAGRGCD